MRTTEGSSSQQSSPSRLHWRQLLPGQHCRYCQTRSDEGALCRACRAALATARPRCQRCSHPLAPGSDYSSDCGECLANPPPFQRSITGADYQPPVSDWINRFKHQRDLRDGHLLTQLLLNQVQLAYRGSNLPQLLVPVPLHWRRQLSRSFNQACWVSRCLQQALQIPIRHALVRQAASHSQQGLQRRQRQHNLHGAYRVPDRYRVDLHNCHVALVDDVVTTTATARTLSGLLLAAGAHQVDVWSLARTPRTNAALDPQGAFTAQ